MVAAVYGALRRATPTDLDMDGSVNGLDTIAAIERILRRSIGDVDGSGKATLDDVMSVACSPESDESDVNVDGDSDLLDLAAVLGLLSTQEPPTLNRVAQILARTTDGGGEWLSLVDEPKRYFHLSPAFDAYASGDESSTQEHQTERSRSWPAMHFPVRSDLWPTVHARTASVAWPPHHEPRSSRLLGEVSSETTDGPR